MGATIPASDVDAGQTLTYSITAGNTGGAFSINTCSGQIEVVDQGELDFETTPVYQLTVKPSEDVTHTLTATLDQQRKTPVAWRVAVTTRIGSGAYSNSYMDLEE